MYAFIHCLVNNYGTYYLNMLYIRMYHPWLLFFGNFGGLYSLLAISPHIINLRVKGMADQVNAGGYELQPYDGEEDVTNCSEVDESASRAVDDGVTWDSSREASDDGILSNDEFFNENSNDDDDDGNHSDRNRSDYDCEGEEGVSHELAATFSSALARDLESQKRQCQPTDYSTNGSAPGASRAEAPAVTAVKERVCCICKERSIYTCPGCGERTCSITCVRVHKEQFNCKGERDLAKKVSLSEFTDKQLQRDYHLLEDARRVVSNCERLFPKMWRYTFRALPPPLYALRKAAKQRGVVCQITSEGMCKRDANTSRFDRRSETIIWRCQFNFHGPDFSVSTDWGNERHRLGDILTYCWSKNPPIPCFHINRRYNRASKWVGAADEATAPVGNEKGGGEDLGKGGSEEGQKDGDEQSQHAGVSASNAPNEDVCEPHQRGPVNDTCAGGPLFVDGHTSEQQHRMWRPSVLDVVPHSSEEADCRRRINEFLSMGPVVILAQAERLGLEKKYFCLSPSQTLNEALRTLFFVNEFPVFDVVHASAAGAYELVTDVDKERIRESFRATPRPPKPERPPRRTKADLSPEELERYAQVPCRLFLAGCCKLSDEDCIYRHCEYKDIPACRSFVKFSTCEKGERCVFRHDAAAVAAGRRRMREERQSKPRPRRRM
uniref:Uncharacterized protein TCIL3000_11_8050 n=1 Tax=Trypanosoma congolense (strain IL3000) TaxID=1068625 RepID=G0V137_TRYCI|nr:unnamed protein product [Trypanosoma congolense IL3000]